MFDFTQTQGKQIRGTVKFEYNDNEKVAKVQFPYMMEHMDVVQHPYVKNELNELKAALTDVGLEVSTINPIGGLTVKGIDEKFFISIVSQVEALGYTAEIWNR